MLIALKKRANDRTKSQIMSRNKTRVGHERPDEKDERERSNPILDEEICRSS